MRAGIFLLVAVVLSAPVLGINQTFTEDATLEFLQENVASITLTGEYTGNGSVRVVLVTTTGEYTIASYNAPDTEQNTVILLDQGGGIVQLGENSTYNFIDHCEETCELGGVEAQRLRIEVDGEFFLESITYERQLETTRDIIIEDVTIQEESWYLSNTLESVCSGQRTLSETIGSSPTSLILYDGNSSPRSWFKEQPAGTIASGTWEVVYRVETGTGTGQGNRVTATVEHRNATCGLKSTILNIQSANLNAGTQQTVTATQTGVGELTIEEGDLIIVRIEHSQGTRNQFVRFNGGSPDNSRLLHPDANISNSPPTWTANLSGTPATLIYGASATYNATGTDPEEDNYRLTVCRTNSITNAYPGTCATDQTLCTSGATASGNQASCEYETNVSDVGILTAYGFLCDEGSATCTASTTVDTTVQGDAPTMSSVTIEPDPAFSSTTELYGYCVGEQAQGQPISYNVEWYINDALENTTTYTPGAELDDLSDTDIDTWMPSAGVITSLASDEKNNKVYLTGLYSFGTAGFFGAYNQTDNMTYNLTYLDSESLSRAQRAAVFDEIDEVVYIGGNQFFGLYNTSSNTVTDLTSEWMETEPVQSLGLDSSNRHVYTGGDNAKFGVYNITDNQFYDLSSTSEGNWLESWMIIRDIDVDEINGLVYIGGSDSGGFAGFAGVYNISDGITYRIEEINGSEWSAVIAMKVDQTSGLVYIGGSHFAVYNLTSKNLTFLNETGIEIMSVQDIAIDQTNNLAYLGQSGIFVVDEGQSGLFAVYDMAQGVSYDLSETNSENWIGSNTITSINFDETNGLVYIGGANKRFGVYREINSVTLTTSLDAGDEVILSCQAVSLGVESSWTNSTTLTVSGGETYVITDPPAGLSFLLESNPAINLTTTGQAGIQDVLVLDEATNRYAGILTINFSSNVSMTGFSAAANSDQEKAYMHNNTPINAITARTLLIPQTQNLGGAYICPGATSLETTISSCEEKIELDIGQTISGITASTVTYTGNNYYQLTGITGTGGQAQVGGSEFYCEMQASDTCSAGYVKIAGIQNSTGGFNAAKAQATQQILLSRTYTSDIQAAIDSENNIIIADRNNGYRKLSPTGDIIWSMSTSIDSRAITIDKDDNFYLSDNIGGGRVHKINGTNGSIIWTFTETTTARSLGIDANNYLFIASDNSTVHRLNPDGTLNWSIDFSTYGFAGYTQTTAADSAGNFYMGTFNGSGPHSALKIDSTGTVVWNRTILTADARGIAVDEERGIMHVTQQASTIYGFNITNGDTIYSSSLGTSSGKVAVDSTGNLYMSNVFNQDLKYINGTTGALITTFDAIHTSGPITLAVDSNDLVITGGGSGEFYKQLLEPARYENSLCCQSTIGTLENSCDTGTTAFSLADFANATVQSPTLETDPVPVCLSQDNIEFTCETQIGACDAQEFCVASISAEDDALIGSCGFYTRSICCSAVQNAIPLINLKDAFTTEGIDTIKWNENNLVGNNASFNQTGGQLKIIPSTTGAHYKALTSKLRYNLSESEIAIEIIDTFGAGSINGSIELAVGSLNASDSVRIGWNGSGTPTLFFKNIVAGTALNESSTTYNSTNHKWWRIKDESTDILFQTSPDKDTWTTHYTISDQNITFNKTFAYAHIIGGTWSTTSIDQNATLDNLNSQFGITSAILQATDSPANTANANLTMTVSGNEYERIIYDWRINNESDALFNIPFEYDGSFNAKDYSTNNLNITSVNPSAITWIPSGGADGGAYYNWTGDGRIIMDTSGWPAIGTGNFTFEAWVRSSSTKDWQTIFAIRNFYPGFYIAGGNTIKIWDGTTISGWTNLTINDGNWHHVAFVREGTGTDQFKFYFDGKPAGTNTYSNSISIGSSIAFGGSTTANEHFLGGIDNPKFYTRALSAEQIAAIYNDRTPQYNLTVSQETNIGENWSVAVTPINGTQIGTTTLSNTVEILEEVTPSGPTMSGSATNWGWTSPTGADLVRVGNAYNWTWVDASTPGLRPTGNATDWSWQ